MKVDLKDLIRRAGKPGIGAILLAGPTASGKSGLAIELASQLNGAIINADSMQVYQELKILSARPDEEEMSQAPHYLYGHREGCELYSAGVWLDEVRQVLQECDASGKLPFFVGGTGLYFKGLLEGLAQMPKISEVAQAKAAATVAASSPDELETLMQEIDPQWVARLNVLDPQRIKRALAVYDETGVPLSHWQENATHEALFKDEEIVKWVLAPAREDVYTRIDVRFETMMDQGGLDEIKALLDLGLSEDLPVMKAIGVAQMAAFLRGEISMEEAIDKAKRDTRRYAKRQRTWLRKHMADWDWLSV